MHLGEEVRVEPFFCSHFLGGAGLAQHLGGLLGEELAHNLGVDTTFVDHSVVHETGKLLIVADSEQNVSWGDGLLLVLRAGVTGKLQNFSGKVFKDGGHEHGCLSGGSLSVSALSEVGGGTADWEVESGLVGAGDGASARLALNVRLSWHICFYLNLLQ